MGLALEVVRKEKRQRVWQKVWELFHHSRVQQWSIALAGDNLSQEVFWRRTVQLPEKLRVAILLRYVCRLKPAQIALLLGGTEQQAHEVLNKARGQLLGADAPVLSDEQSEHPEIQSQALAALDDLASFSMSRDTLDAHLETCADCRDAIDPYRELHAVLPEKLASRWNIPDLPPIDDLLPEETRRTFRLADLPRLAKVRLWDVMLIGGVLMAVLIVGWNLAREDTHRGKPIFLPTPGPTATPQKLLAGRTLQDPLAGQNDAGTSSEMIFTWQPQFSANGRWLAYTRLVQKLEDGVPHSMAEVLLTDVQTRESQLIGEQGHSSMGWYTYSPALSADGRYLAFESNTVPANMISGLSITTTYTCPDLVGEEPTCSDVMLYDRQLGKIQLVSQALDGGRSNWHSRFPSVSADGRYIAFWSAATNLAEGFDQACAKSGVTNHCWDF